MLVAVAAWPVSDAWAIVGRDDVPDTAYVVDDAEYPAVVTLFPPDDCAGTLIHAAHLLTVAHCAVDLSEGDTLDVGGTPHVIAEVTLHPQWEDGDEYDVAVVRFSEAVQGIEPVPIYRGSAELGALVSIVGRGVTATGLVGESGGSSDGLLRRATNVVSVADDLLLEVVFERPTDAGVTDLEGVGASGDSGGPVFLEVDGTVYLAGLNAFGDAPDGIGIAQYGSWDYQTRVSAYADWIDDVLAGVAQPDVSTGESGCACTVEDEPPAMALVLLLAVLATIRTRSADCRLLALSPSGGLPPWDRRSRARDPQAAISRCGRAASWSSCATGSCPWPAQWRAAARCRRSAASRGSAPSVTTSASTSETRSRRPPHSRRPARR